MPNMIDLRSDTVTKPTPQMRRAMAEAEVGDDVADADPTVVRLQERTAELLGKEAALYVTSGTQANQIALRVHCRPGDEFICEAESHLFHYEQGGYAQLSGLAARPVEGASGVMSLDQLRPLVRRDDDHFVRTRLIVIENTHNRGSGRVQPQQQTAEVCDWAKESGLACHLDGARLWNASVASGSEESQMAAPFDSVSVCFSKGLGAPVGSCLAGSKEFIREARRVRKVLGGGLRQAGIIAAGALHAVENHRERLADDHEHARMLAEGIRDCPMLAVESESVDTNIVVFRVDPDWGTAAEFSQSMADSGVAAFAIRAQSVRLVTHLDVDRSQVVEASRIIRQIATGRRASVAT